MPDQRLRSLKILALVQAIVGGLVAVAIFALYGVKPSLLSDIGVSLTAAILGTVGVVYFLTLHQVFVHSRPALSTLILTLITSVNFLLVIASTGGLSSPYYSLWLLAIVAAGIFGRRETISILTITILYYAYELINEGVKGLFTTDHIIQLGITLIAGGLAEWVHSRNRKASATTSRLAAISGQLTAEQLKAEAIMTSINEGVIVIDGSRKIQLFNKAAQELTGWDESSALDIDYNAVFKLVTTDDHELTELNDPFTEAWKKEGNVTRDNLVLITRTGHKSRLNISISPIFDASKKPNGAIVLFRDISREKEVERQKDEFVSTASHEMRTPVAAIEGYISLAMNPNVATIDDRAKKYLEKAHDTIGHLGGLFRDLLSVTKAEEGQLGGKVEAINLGKLLQGAVDDMLFTVQKKNLTLVYQIGASGGKTISPIYHVAVNPERLREVVMNLIENAIKFTPEGGIKVTLEGNDKEVTVGVSDTGIGIAPEDSAHLFQKFYRIDNSATRTIGGTGLGLYLCRRVIELFNGRIWVESKTNQGSTFKFSLPRLTQDEVSRMESSGATSATNITPGVAAPAGAVVQPQTPNGAMNALPTPHSLQAAETGTSITPSAPPTTAPSHTKRSDLDPRHANHRIQ